MSRLSILLAVITCAGVHFCPATAFGQDSDQARRLAEATIEKMGGMDEWNSRQFLVWDIFGETHYWDKWSGDFRWESDSLLVLMNLNSKSGRVWIEGDEVLDEDRKRQILDRAYARWVNNSYWLIMPYKLLDPGVNLAYVGIDTSMTGQVADVIELTFDNVGLTPDNRYLVYIDRASGMVCQWAYYPNRENTEPDFMRVWDEWKEYDGLWMSTGRGRARNQVSNLSLPKELPHSVFTDPSPVSWRPRIR